MKFTARQAHATSDAACRIDDVWSSDIADDGISRAMASASTATLTGSGINGVGEESLTSLGSAMVPLYMFLIFFPEIIEC